MRKTDNVEQFVPLDVRDVYEVICVCGAAALLYTNHPALFEELLDAHSRFRFPESYAPDSEVGRLK